MPPPHSVCHECQGTIEYVPDALCYMCVSCGVMNLDQTQYELQSAYDDITVSTWRAPDIPQAHATHGRGPGGPEKEERWMRNAVAAYAFIRSVLRRMDYEGLYDRVMALFAAMMQKQGFKWGQTSTTTVGACVFIAIRESGKGETVRSIAATIDVPTSKLTRMLHRTLQALGMKLGVEDPLSHVPRLLKVISDTRSDPRSPTLPSSLLSYLSNVSLNSVENLATNLQYVSDSVNLTHNRTTAPVACALIVMAFEGETGHAAPCLPRLTEFLSQAVGINPKTSTERYLEFQTLISQWKLDLPWLAAPEKPQRKGKSSQREEHASLIKDVVAFQEELWRRRQATERSPEPSSRAASPLRLELEGGEDAGSEDEPLELSISPSPTIFSISTVGSSTPVSSASSGRTSADSRPVKKRRLGDPPNSAGVPDALRVPNRQSKYYNTCIRPAYAKRNTRQMDRDIKIEQAAATLLGGGHGERSLRARMADQATVRSHVLAAGVEGLAGDTRLLTRLGALSALVGEANIEDKELFDDGELESMLRDEKEAEVLRQIWEDAESKEPVSLKLARSAPRVRVTKQVDAAALEQALTGLKTNAGGREAARHETWVTDLMVAFEDDEAQQGDDVRTLSSLEDFALDLASGTYDPFADYEEL
ncbi:hypothetical protein FRB96_001645 [Tulasnella sp. 330]|nr:hypothetical protein FRB96_001645 [Tulasnella sp. 330]KAG8883568.1 hypothetical protein FRB98_003067 [Tulasnella sp. 332]